MKRRSREEGKGRNIMKEGGRKDKRKVKRGRRERKFGRVKIDVFFIHL